MRTMLFDDPKAPQHHGAIRGRTIAWSGDANNVLTSWMHAAERFAFCRG